MTPRRRQAFKTASLGGVIRVFFSLLLVAAPARAQSPADSLPDPWLSPDKPAHVFAGFWSAGVGYAAADRADGDRAQRRLAAVATGLAAGIAKEAFDRWGQDERFSWKDLTADVAGIGLLLAVMAAAEP